MATRTRNRTSKTISAFREFTDSPLAGGIVLIMATILAITLSNLSSTSDWYHNLWETKFIVGFEGFALNKTLEHWINDGLMTLFFFAVGLEIKREIVSGQLQTIKQASLPIAAALGGMIVPALIYTMFNKGGIAEAGWGIPMATDIAFALGILSLMSSRVPLSLKIFLTALAIVDDLGAIIVIAIFYSSHIDWTMIGLAGVVLGLLFLLNKLDVHRMRWYLLLSIILWILFLKSGIHATISGVLIAMAMPSSTRYSKRFFNLKGQKILTNFDNPDFIQGDTQGREYRKELIKNMKSLAHNSISPSERLENLLHGTITFFVMPIFAFANAGIAISVDGLQHLGSDQGLGIITGLIVGKPLGIMLFSLIVIKSGISSMPKGSSWPKLLAAGCLGGIGFTMSIFINNLAFSDPSLVNYGKMAILVASVGSIITGTIMLLSTPKTAQKDNW